MECARRPSLGVPCKLLEIMNLVPQQKVQWLEADVLVMLRAEGWVYLE